MRRIKSFNEYIFNGEYIKKFEINRLSEKEEDYITSVSFKIQNIANIIDYYIFLGYNPLFDKMRIKIFNRNDNKCFVILIDNYEIIGDYDVDIFNSEVLDNLKKWLLLNKEIIYLFSKSKDLDIDHFSFVNKLKSL